MNLLLLLTALFSALTGAVSTVREPTAAHAAVTAAAICADVASASRSVASRPIQALAEARTVVASLLVLAIAPYVPLYASRLRV